MQVRVTSTSADIKIAELGHGDGDEAVQKFSGFRWSDALNRMRELESAGNTSVVSPDMTFTALPAHLVVQAEDTEHFNVEVCLPRPIKLFGVFQRVKFYTFDRVSKDRIPSMLRQFCADDLQSKHQYFTQLVTANAT